MNLTLENKRNKNGSDWFEELKDICTKRHKIDTVNKVLIDLFSGVLVIIAEQYTPKMNLFMMLSLFHWM